MLLTAEQIDAAKTKRGGWTRDTLAGWGVPWPPPKGWRKALMGEPSRQRPAQPVVHNPDLWTTRSGKIVAISAMGDQHLMNAIDRLREIVSWPGAVPADVPEKLIRLEAEMERRASLLPADFAG